MQLAEIQNRLQFFKNPNFSFLPQNHTYWWKSETGLIELESATRFVKSFHQEFDPTGVILFSCAKRDKISPSDLKKKWNKNGREKAQIGTDCHEKIHYFNETGKRYEYSEAQPIHRERMNAFWELYERELQFLTPICSEVMMFSPEIRKAGTTDRLYHIDEKCCVFDWKTNEILKKYTGYLKHPFTEYRDTDVNRYSIQLSLYTVFLNLIGIETGPSYLGWLGNPKGELIPCLDFTTRLRNYLNV